MKKNSCLRNLSNLHKIININMINAWINTYDDCNPCKTIATREIQVVEPWSYMPTYIKKYIFIAHIMRGLELI